MRLIVNADYAEKWGEKMMSEGVNLTANIRTFPNVHNKGFVIDGKTVVVSSQNFSPAGVSDNRDAGVILESEEIAQYFGPIFDADWGASRDLTVHAKPGQGAVAKKGKPTAKKAKKGKPAAKKAKKGKPAAKKVKATKKPRKK